MKHLFFKVSARYDDLSIIILDKQKIVDLSSAFRHLVGYLYIELFIDFSGYEVNLFRVYTSDINGITSSQELQKDNVLQSIGENSIFFPMSIVLLIDSIANKKLTSKLLEQLKDRKLTSILLVVDIGRSGNVKTLR